MVVEYTSWEDPVIGFQVEPFNWRLRKARQARGWTRAELARQIGVTPGVVGDAEKLRHVSVAVREKLALCLQIPEDELFPGVIDALPKDGPGMIEIPFEAEQVQRWLEAGTPDALEGATERIENADLRADIMTALDRLPPRERDVLVRRFGLDGSEAQTLEEVGKHLGVIRERVRQLESAALRRLRKSEVINGLWYHVDADQDGPLRTVTLKEWADAQRA